MLDAHRCASSSRDKGSSRSERLRVQDFNLRMCSTKWQSSFGSHVYSSGVLSRIARNRKERTAAASQLRCASGRWKGDVVDAREDGAKRKRVAGE